MPNSQKNFDLPKSMLSIRSLWERLERAGAFFPFRGEELERSTGADFSGKKIHSALLSSVVQINHINSPFPFNLDLGIGFIVSTRAVGRPPIIGAPDNCCCANILLKEEKSLLINP